MKRTAFLTFVALSLSVAAHAQSTHVLVSPAAMGMPAGAQLERSVEIDGNPATQEWVVADYAVFPVRRAVMQMAADRTICTGPFEYWFGDNPYIWPTWITLDGLTKVTWALDYGDWVIADLDIPACGK